VFGDLLRVTASGLARMDGIELPFGYVRRRARVQAGNRALAAWVNWAPARLAGRVADAMLAGGDWLQHCRGPAPAATATRPVTA
jgi:gamma-glutamylcyclotransferase (GGCT)/AIG2-like uncharacterized protein YtfP